MALTAMEILERCRRAEDDKRRLRERIDMYWDTAEHMTASLDGIGSRSTGEADHTGALLAKIDAVEREIKQRDEEYTAEITAACQLLETLPDLECSIMTGYYVRRQSLKEICADKKKSYGHVSRCKTAATRPLRAISEGEVIKLLPDWYIAKNGSKRSGKRDI